MIISKYKNIIIITLLLLLIIIVPIIINELYKSGNGYITIWGKEEVLSYYGTILGSAATIGAVVITIMYNEKVRKIDRINQIRPLLDHQLDISTANKLKDQGGRNKKIIFLSFKEVREIKQATKEMIENVNNRKDLYVNYHISNVGGGNALVIKLCIDGKKTILPFNLKVNEEIDIGIIINKSYMDEYYTNINFMLLYRNVDGSAYYNQSENLAFQKSDNNYMFINVSGRVNSQQEISEVEYNK